MKSKSILLMGLFVFACFSVYTQAQENEQHKITFLPVSVSSDSNLSLSERVRLHRLAEAWYKFQHSTVICTANRYEITCEGTINEESAVDEILYREELSSRAVFGPDTELRVIFTERIGDLFCYSLKRNHDNYSFESDFYILRGPAVSCVSID